MAARKRFVSHDSKDKRVFGRQDKTQLSEKFKFLAGSIERSRRGGQHEKAASGGSRRRCGRHPCFRRRPSPATPVSLCPARNLSLAVQLDGLLLRGQRRLRLGP